MEYLQQGLLFTVFTVIPTTPSALWLHILQNTHCHDISSYTKKNSDLITCSAAKFVVLVNAQLTPC